jgi:small-conductance mechanosensitive channel
MYNFDHYWNLPLVSVGGGTITLGSFLLGLGLLILTFLLSGLVGRWVRALLERRGTPTGTQAAEAKIVSYTLATLGVLIAVDSMGLRLNALFAASTVVAVGIGFGMQNVAQNFISGLILLVEQPVRQGDFIRFNDAVGVVENIGLRATHVITDEEVTIVIPNSEFISKAVINRSRPSSRLRIRVGVGVAYGSALNDVRDILLQIAAEHPKVLTSPPPEVRFDAFADSCLSFSLLCWVTDPDPDVDERIASDLRYAIDTAFRARHIEIPFPQQDLHVRSGLDALLPGLAKLNA